jgi:hypothetical protein
MSIPGLLPHLTKGASITPLTDGFRLLIPDSHPAVPVRSASGYRLAQLDDYAHLRRQDFLHTLSTLRLRARASSGTIPGTWGFGLWNDPFGFSIGFGGNPFRLPALPNAAWFFHASPHNYLSFRDDKPASGFLAQTFRASPFHPLLIPAGLALPFSRRSTRRLLSRVVDEEGVNLSVDVTQWHTYRLKWKVGQVAFEVDDVQVLETPVSPRPPLGIILWIDNQYAAFTPEGRLAFGVLEGNEEWLEIENFEIK